MTIFKKEKRGTNHFKWSVWAGTEDKSVSEKKGTEVVIPWGELGGNTTIPCKEVGTGSRGKVQPILSGNEKDRVHREGGG